MEPNLGPGRGGLFGIIDGHGGVTSAQMISQLLPAEYRKLLEAGVPPGKAMVDALAEVERVILNMSRSNHLVHQYPANLTCTGLSTQLIFYVRACHAHA